MTQEDRQAIETLYNQGFNPEDIADALDIDECEVIDYCITLLEQQL